MKLKRYRVCLFDPVSTMLAETNVSFRFYFRARNWVYWANLPLLPDSPSRWVVYDAVTDEVAFRS